MSAAMVMTTDYLKLRSCCILEYAQRVFHAGVELHLLIRIEEAKPSEVTPDRLIRPRLDFVEKLGDLAPCANCSSGEHTPDRNGEVVSSASLA